MTIDGYSLLRLLAERDRSKLFLARDLKGRLCAFKLQKPLDPTHLQKLVQRDARLQPLTQGEGLLEILAHGLTEDGWTWKAMPLADNLAGLAPLDTDEGRRQYCPMTLLAWVAEKGRPSASLAAQWGIRLTAALATLHRAGLVHRDVKPANVLFLGGQPALGDYGLVGEPEDKVHYSGTEGYQPLEGTNDAGADLFALGKTLYEAWTGGNRLEFPSLPRAILDAKDWNSTGHRLNEVILRACDALPHNRFRSAEEFSAALVDVVSGRRRIHRRRWLGTAASLAALGTGVFLLLKYVKAPARIVWRRVRQKGFNVESWQGHQGTADWVRHRMYSYCSDNHGRTFEAVDLQQFTLIEKSISQGPILGGSSILQPETRELWLLEGGNGEASALDPETLNLRRLGGGPCDERHYSTRTYWNPVTRRVGILGGYGHFAVRNDRLEFDSTARTWVEVEKDRESPGPWRRETPIPLVPDGTGKKLYLIGGHGSRTGKEGEQMPGIRRFDGRLHLLNDIWELDLESGSWRCLLTLGALDTAVFRAAAYFPSMAALVVFEGLDASANTAGPANAWMLRPGVDLAPMRLPLEGEPSNLATAWAWTIDPQTGELLMFANDGIFRISLMPA